MTTESLDLDAHIRSKLETGAFRSRDDFFLEAVRVYRELEVREVTLRHELQLGIDAADHGLVEPFDVEALKRELATRIDEFGQPR